MEDKELKKLQNKMYDTLLKGLETLISSTPISIERNELTDLNIKLMQMKIIYGH